MTEQNKQYVEDGKVWLSQYIILFAETKDSFKIMCKILQDEQKVPEGNYPTFEIKESYVLRCIERLLDSIQAIKTIVDIKHFGNYLKQMGILK